MDFQLVEERRHILLCDVSLLVLVHELKDALEPIVWPQTQFCLQVVQFLVDECDLDDALEKIVQLAFVDLSQLVVSDILPDFGRLQRIGLFREMVRAVVFSPEQLVVHIDSRNAVDVPDIWVRVVVAPVLRFLLLQVPVERLFCQRQRIGLEGKLILLFPVFDDVVCQDVVDTLFDFAGRIEPEVRPLAFLPVLLGHVQLRPNKIVSRSHLLESALSFLPEPAGTDHLAILAARDSVKEEIREIRDRNYTVLVLTHSRQDLR